jgi:hypothetical protein
MYEKNDPTSAAAKFVNDSPTTLLTATSDVTFG